MKTHKLLGTIAILDTLERKRFKNVIKNKKRNSLVSLLDLCLSRIDNKQALPAKEVIYEFLFGEKYTKENDFILRNEFRLLTQEAELFITNVEVAKQFPGICEVARLQRILKSGNKSLFKKEFDSAYTKYKGDYNFLVAADQLFLDFFISSQEISLEHFDEIKQKINSSMDNLKGMYNRVLSDYEVRLAFADKVCSAVSRSPVQTRTSGILPTPVADALVDYRQLKTKSYYSSGLPKISLLLEAERWLSSESMMAELGKNELFWLYSTVGLEYYVNYDFENAVRYYKKVFTHPDVAYFNRLPEAALNYFSALMSTDTYELAIETILPFEDRMATSTAVFYRYICLKALAFLFIGNAPAARKELNRIEHHHVTLDFLYWRTTLILSYAVEGRWDDAQNEYSNVLKNKTMRGGSRSDIENLKRIMHVLIKTGIELESHKLKNTLELELALNKTIHMLQDPSDFLHHPKLIRVLLDKMLAKAKTT